MSEGPASTLGSSVKDGYRERMRSEQPSAGDDRIKHLEMIQTIISRMAHNSFTLKGWAVTLTAALLVLASDRGTMTAAACLYCIPAVVFWMLDAYYLALERRFRGLYERARLGRIDLFSMEVAESDGSISSAARSLGVWPLYGTLLVMTAAVVMATTTLA